jgi:hypothetical protein
VLLVAVGVGLGKGAVEARRGHESGAGVGRIVVHGGGGLRRRRALGKRRGQRRARDLHSVSAGLRSWMRVRRRMDVLSWEAGSGSRRAEVAMGVAAEIKAQCSRRNAGDGRVQCAAAWSQGLVVSWSCVG